MGAAKIIKTRILILVACVATFTCVAQSRHIKPEHYNVINLTTRNGLPSDATNFMIKDVQGFMWIGGNRGVSRFDGTTFKKYLSDELAPGSINSDEIFGFVEDSLSNIWIGTLKGLSRYDINGDTFTNFDSDIDSSKSDGRFLDHGIRPFWATTTHVYGLDVQSQRILSYDIRSLEERILFEFGESHKLNIGGISINSTILDATSNSLWMFEHGDVSGGIRQIFLDDARTQVYTWPCYGNTTGHRHNAEAMRLDRERNSIWINSGDGLIEFSLANKQFRHIDAFDKLRKLTDYDRYVGIDIDRTGNIWLATRPNGILIYDPNTNALEPLFSDPDLQQRVGQHNFEIYCDRDGIGWVNGYMGAGIFELLPLSPSVKRYAGKPYARDSLSNGRIYNIVPGPQGKMWLGTGDGLNIFDPLTEKFEVLREKDLPGIKGTAIVPLGVDTLHQKAWLTAGSNDISKLYDMDMYELDLKTRKCTPITFMSGSRQLDTLMVESTQVNRYKSGIMIYNEKLPGMFELGPEQSVADLIIPLVTKYMISEVELVEERRLFLRSYEALPNLSFEMKDDKWVKIPHMLDSLEWQALLYNERDQTHWINFKNDLTQFDKNFRKIRTYSPEDGSVGNIFEMLIDIEGNLWFMNDVGHVGRLNVATGRITYLSEADGYRVKEYDWSTPFVGDARGNIYLGTGYMKGTEGLDVINVKKYSPATIPTVYLRSLTVNQIPFSASVPINHSKELSLPHDQNTIVIETGIIDYYSKGRGQVRYKLEKDGKPEHWQFGPAYHTLRYDDLSPGKYRLVLQASNPGSDFSAEKIVFITIDPPFWARWWFRALVVLVVVVVAYAIIQFRSRSLRRRNADLEEKVIMRTKELKHSLEDLRSAQAQLIQSEKMASLGELTAGIAHEIQNPLNFVNNFSDLNKELVAEMSDEIDKGNIEQVKIIAKDIADNEEKINHHGKRADAIVKGMLQHSRTSTGKKEATNINTLTDEYLRLAYHGLRAKDKSFNVTLNTDFDQSIGSINIVSQDIGRAILNLITNAFYAVTEKKKQQSVTPHLNHEYEPTVWVVTKKVMDTLEVRVKDNGNGIPKNVLEKIFQPFFTTKPTGQGTGLGLSLSYDIIKAHDGTLKAETVEGEGTEFIIVLPIQPIT